MKNRITITTSPRLSPVTERWLAFHAALPIPLADLIFLTKTPAQRKTKKIQLIQKELAAAYNDAMFAHNHQSHQKIMIHADKLSEFAEKSHE